MVTGVVGGMIDVNGLVSQLMQIERQPLTRLEQRETQILSRLTAFGRVQSALSTLDSALNALSRATTFSAGKASTTGDGVTAAVSGTPAEGRYSVTVTQLARVQSTASARVATATTDIGSGTVTISNADGSQVLGTFNVGDTGTGTLTELRDEINAANIGVRASLISDAGQIRLVLNSKESGLADAFSVSASSGLSGLALTTVQTAQDASFTINGLALTSPSNVLKDAIEGLTLTLTQVSNTTTTTTQSGGGNGNGGGGSGSTTTVTSSASAEVIVGPDAEKITSAVQDFVKAYNDFDKLVAELTKYDPNTKTASILNGESVLRQVQSQIRGMARGVMTVAAGDFSRLSDVGISMQTDGTLKLDESKLGELAAADPAKLARLFTTGSNVEAEQGFAVGLRARVKAIIEPAGTLDSRQAGLRASIRTLDQQQERMQARLVVIEQRLRRQYSQLDALLTTSQSQSNALANALAGLPSTQG